MFAKCKCGHNDKGKKYCDLEGGDVEWANVFDKFKVYFERSKNCHNAEGFGGCNNNLHYKAFKCAQIKAKLYVDLVDIPPCLKKLAKVHPHFFEYSKYCLSAIPGKIASLFKFLCLSFLLFLM